HGHRRLVDRLVPRPGGARRHDHGHHGQRVPRDGAADRSLSPAHYAGGYGHPGADVPRARPAGSGRMVLHLITASRCAGDLPVRRRAPFALAVLAASATLALTACSTADGAGPAGEE